MLVMHAWTEPTCDGAPFFHSMILLKAKLGWLHACTYPNLAQTGGGGLCGVVPNALTKPTYDAPTTLRRN